MATSLPRCRSVTIQPRECTSEPAAASSMPSRNACRTPKPSPTYPAVRTVCLSPVKMSTVGLIELMIGSSFGKVKLVRGGFIFAKTKLVNPFFTVLTKITNTFNHTTLSTSCIRPDSYRESYSLAGVPKMSTAISSNAVSHNCTSHCLIKTRKR